MTDTPLIPIEEDASLGPAMRALTPMQRAFVAALVQTGCNQKKAAELAGYSLKWEGAAWTLSHHPAVQAAILEECQKLIRSDGPMALHVLRTVAQDPTVAARDRIKAATELLNRGGFHAVTQHNLNVSVHLTEAQKDAEIRALAAELGLDNAATAKLLGKPAVTDAEFVEITDPPTDIAPPRQPTGARITNPDRTPEERAQGRARYRETPEERAARQEQTRLERIERGKREYAEAKQLREELGIPDPLAREQGIVSETDPTRSDNPPGNSAEPEPLETELW